MKRSILILTIASAAPAMGGTRSAGSGAGAIIIPADSINDGGAVSTGGSGSGAVTNLGSFGGVAGTVSTATPATANQQGYIPQILPPPEPPLTGYDLWASLNIPAGQPAAFNADADRDGLPNGVEYALGATVMDFDTILLRFRIEYPATIPSDVNLSLERSLTLGAGSWVTIVSWVNGAAPAGAAGIELQARVRDPIRATEPKAWYRYRAEKR